MHQLLNKQIKRSTSEDGTVDLSKLYDYVTAAYTEMDCDRIRADRAHSLMAEEHDELNRNLEKVVDELSTQNMRFELALDNMTQGLCMINAAREIAVVNRRFVKIYELVQDKPEYGMHLSELLLCSNLFLSQSKQNGKTLMSNLIDLSLNKSKAEIQQRFSSGQTISVTHLPMDDGGSVLTVEDITERVRREEQIRHMAHHDSLTGLPNRELFQNRLSEALEKSRLKNHNLALIYLDLDHFKEVNDTLGHDVGDQLLKQVIKRIQAVLSGEDLFARLGGDEFAIIRECATCSENIAALAKQIINATSNPYKIANNDIVIGASIGISMVEDGNIKDRGSSELQKKADIALYSAKNAGRGIYHFFKEEMDVELNKRKALELDLRRAVSELQQFEIHYQPQLSNVTGRITGFEALLRWHHPTYGMVPPDEFIPLAEDIGEIETIGNFVLKRACQALNRHAGISVAVNFSPIQFRNKNLPGIVERHLQEINFAPERLEIEVTERTLLDNSTSVIQTLSQLKDMGISIVMDDFGTGYSSLSYLRQFPFDKIKIDRDFIHDIVNNENDQAIINAIIYLGKQLGMTVVAEGIENSEQVELLSAAGCDEMQGYHYSRPVPEDSIEYLLNEYRLKLLFDQRSEGSTLRATEFMARRKMTG